MTSHKISKFVAAAGLAALLNGGCAMMSAGSDGQIYSLENITASYSSQNYRNELKQFITQKKINTVFLGSFEKREVKFSEFLNEASSFYSFKVDEVYLGDKEILGDRAIVVYPWLKLDENAPVGVYQAVYEHKVNSIGFREDTPDFKPNERVVVFAREENKNYRFMDHYLVKGSNAVGDRSQIPLKELNAILSEPAKKDK
jgi:hypothetical protein